MVCSRILAVLAASTAASELACDSCGIEATAMLQRSGRTALKTKTTEALDNLLHTATRMLREGATPEVISFSEDTLQAIKDEVMPAIQRDHAAQQQLIYEHYNATVSFTHTYTAWTERLLEAREMESKDSQEHKACRAEEKKHQIETEACDEELQVRWEKVQEVEEDMDDLSERIQTEWCEPGVNRSVSEFRDEAVKKFNKYSKKRAAIHEVTLLYEEWVTVCESNHTQLSSKRTECEEKQHELETSSCLAADLTREAGSKLTDEWPMVATIYDDTVASVQKAEAARKKEYSTLVTVECLLNRIHERGGKPCDENGEVGEAQSEMKVCHEKSANVTHLEVDVPQVPEKPSAPEAKPQPCTQEFIAQEYHGMEVAECRPCEAVVESIPVVAAQATSAPVITVDPTQAPIVHVMAPAANVATTASPVLTKASICTAEAGSKCYLAPDNSWLPEDLPGYISCLKECCQDYDPERIFDGITCKDILDMGFGCDRDVPGRHIPTGTLVKHVCGSTCGTCSGASQ